MTQQKYYKCCARQCGYQMNPLEASNTYEAGGACLSCATDAILSMPLAEEMGTIVQEMSLAEEMAMQAEDDCLLATAYIAEQNYVVGFCPNETLKQGTLFPELVRPYM